MTFKKKNLLNRHRNKCNCTSLTELVLSSTENLESITRLKSKLHPYISSPAFWWVQDAHHSCKLLQHSGNISALLVTLCPYSSKEPVRSVWCCFVAVDSQSQTVSPSEIRTPLLSMDHKPEELTFPLSGGQGKQDLAPTCKAETIAMQVQTCSETKTKAQAHVPALLKTSAAI